MLPGTPGARHERPLVFQNRHDAGRRLAAALQPYRDAQPVIVALPRGGVPVARPIADALHAPLDLVVVRKLGAPIQPELAMGAVGPGDALVLDEALVRRLHVTPDELDRIVRRERAEVDRRTRTYRGDRPAPDVDGRTVILVDDGIATGATVRVAIQILRQMGAARLVLAVPVLPESILSAMERDADDLVYLSAPDDFMAIGQWYTDFGQVTDEQVIDLLKPSTEGSS